MGKYLFAVIAVFIICGKASAQLQPGKLYPGISLENRFFRYEKDIGFKPEVSYALDKHNLIGVKLNYFRSNKYEYYGAARGYNRQIGAGFSYTYFRYFKNSNKLGWFANANLDFNRVNFYDIKTTGESVLSSRQYITELSIRPGLFYKPSSKIMIFANAGGISLIRNQGNIEGPLNFGRQLNIGVLIDLDIFKKKNK